MVAAMAGKCPCWTINVIVAVALYKSIKNGKHEHESCCLNEACVTCLNNGGDHNYCSSPCSFPDDRDFPPPNPYGIDSGIDMFDDTGICRYTATWEDESIFVGKVTKTFEMSSGCSDYCLSFDTREQILVENEVEEKLIYILKVAMIMTIISIVPVIGSVANVICDVVLIAMYFGGSGFVIVEASGCHIMYDFQTGILWLAVLQVVIDVIEALIDLAGLFAG